MKINKIDLWCIISPILMLLICLISQTGIIQAVASITGVIYISLIIKENKLGYIFAVLNVALYAIITWKQGLFGTAVFNVAYTLPILIYGYVFWNKNQGKDKGNVKRMTNNTRIKYIIIGILTIAIYYLIATLLFQINNALIDAIIVAFSFFGNLLIARKYIEQWYVFSGLNIINIAFWTMTAVIDTNSIALVGMYIIYLINNIIGVCAWNKKLKDK